MIERLKIIYNEAMYLGLTYDDLVLEAELLRQSGKYCYPSLGDYNEADLLEVAVWLPMNDSE